MRILVVDDEPAVLKAMGRLLEKHGHEVTVAGDGGSALRAIFTSTQKFELMLLDLNMPKFDGFDLLRLRRMCAELDEVPIIIVSGVSEDEMRDRVKATGQIEGVALWFSKPVDFDSLLRAIAHFDRTTVPPPPPKDPDDAA
jgi:twitching motility two-component system response regulator PilH